MKTRKIEDVIDKIRPIPKYIINLIQKKDQECYAVPNNYVRYYSYLTKLCGDIAKVTVAVRHFRNKWYCKQVAVHGLHLSKCFVKDIEYSYIGGYTVGWYAEGLTKYAKWYEYGDWGWADDKYFRVYAPVVNMDYLKKFPQYQYAAWDKTHIEILRHLRLYEQFPQIEYLVKAQLHGIATSKPILRRIATDKKFCKWLMANREKIRTRWYYNDVVLRAYLSGRDIDELQKEKKFRLELAHDDNYRRLLKDYDKKTIVRIVKYLFEKDVSVATYSDYLRACEYLGLDMTEDKNMFPHDFHRWHDIRTDEYKTAKAMKDAEERKELYEKFALISEKYLCLQHSGKYGFVAIIAKSPAELVREGETLHHCVGRMGYDQKFIREQSLIFFIRLKEQPDVPYVTVEYSPETHKILQLHGANNSAPDEATANYIKRVWLPYANKHLKQIAA